MNDLSIEQSFTEKFRGSFDLVKDRLYIYQDLVRPLLDLKEDFSALDLGCGRGEWLEIITELGFSVLGIDSSNFSKISCKIRNLPMKKRNAISFLKKSRNSALSLITAFHLIEHLQFSDQLKLFKYSYNALRPGGILILETPNSNNLNTASNNFWIDPTHIRPAHPELLLWMARESGFNIVSVHGIRRSNLAVDTFEELSQIHEDCALIAIKEI